MKFLFSVLSKPVLILPFLASLIVLNALIFLSLRSEWPELRPERSSPRELSAAPGVVPWPRPRPPQTPLGDRRSLF